MNRRRDPERLGDVLRGLLRRYGLDDLETWQRIEAEWAEVAPTPWDRQARPVSLAKGVLVVEAITPAAVGVLRYGVAGLMDRLARTYGQGVVEDVRLRAPSPRRPR